LERKPSLSDKIAKLALFLSIAAAGFGYGYMAHRENLFPQPLLQRAFAGISALLEVQDKIKGESKPASFLSFDEKAENGPVVRSYVQPTEKEKNDWFLIVGGPFEYLEQCPRFGCVAWVVDRNGKVIHKWEADLDKLWSNVKHIKGLTSPENYEAQHVELLADGSIIVVFWNGFAYPKGAGMAKFDINGKLVWVRRDNAHHWFTTDGADRIFTPGQYVIKPPYRLGNTKVEVRCNIAEEAMIDIIEVVDLDGKTVETIPLFDILIENGYAGLIERTELKCDPLHLNFVQYVNREIASKIPGVSEGDLLVSMRNINSVALLDPARRKVKWLMTGLNVKQHSPRFLPDGSIVLFDNQGGDRAFGGSRIARHSIFEHTVETVFPDHMPADGRFLSDFAGHITVNPDGDRLLVSVTQAGRIWEISRKTGRIKWSYNKVFPAKNYPGAREKPDAHVRVEAFGAYYVDREKLAAAIAANARK